MSLSRTVATLITASVILLASLWAATERSQAAAVTCPGTFSVLHNDKIGSLSLPKGKYRITVVNGAKLSCPSATRNFQNFLWDYDGILPKPWTFRVLGVGDGKFFQRTNTAVGFRVKRVSTPRTVATRAAWQRCPGSFRVLNNDRIGGLALPKGPYFIYRSTNPALGCTNASDLFRKFLNYPSGMLPAPWKLNSSTAVFTNTQKRFGFRIKKA